MISGLEVGESQLFGLAWKKCWWCRLPFLRKTASATEKSANIENIPTRIPTMDRNLNRNWVHQFIKKEKFLTSTLFLLLQYSISTFSKTKFCQLPSTLQPQGINFWYFNRFNHAELQVWNMDRMQKYKKLDNLSLRNLVFFIELDFMF